MFQDNLSRALIEFKRDKVNKQNARLSLVNSVYDNPSMPQRKIMLSVGANNYRPPLERSKSAPRLMAIEEAGEEEDGEDPAGGKSAQLKESRRCCTVDPLYPAMTLGRRRCKRGHSIRRTGNKPTRIPNIDAVVAARPPSPTIAASPSPVDTNEDLDKLLLSNDYDTKSPLAGELMSYLDNRLKQKTTSLLDLQEENDDYRHYQPDSIKNTQSLDDLDRYSDGEDNYVAGYFGKSCQLKNDDKEAILEQSNDTHHHQHVSSLQVTLSSGGGEYSSNLTDIDENSLSSGCESVSTVTTSIEVQEALAKIDSEKCKNSLDMDGSATETKCATSVRSTRKKISWPKTNGSDSESEFSDESGYVEYKESAPQCVQKTIVSNIVWISIECAVKCTVIIILTVFALKSDIERHLYKDSLEIDTMRAYYV